MTLKSIFFVVMALFLGFGSPVLAQHSVNGLQSVLVQGASGQWLITWVEQQSERLGPFFDPRVQVENLRGISDRFEADVNSVALLPSMVHLTADISDLVRVPAGVSACLAVAAGRDSQIGAIGDLHALAGPVRVAVASDINHIASFVIETFALSPFIEVVEFDNRSAIFAVLSGQVDLAFLSTENGARFDVGGESPPLHSLGFINVSGSVIASAIAGGYEQGHFSVRLLDGIRARSYDTICDPVHVVSREGSNFRPTMFFTEHIERPLPNDAPLLHRALTAVQMLWETLTVEAE